MEKQYTKDELFEIYQKLPDDIQDVFFSVETINQIKKVGDENKLHLDQQAKLGEEIGFVLLGITRSQDFIQNIKKKINLTDDQARSVGVGIDVAIFSKIKEALQKLQENRAAGVAVEQTKKPGDQELFEARVGKLFRGPQAPSSQYIEKPDPYREPLE